MAEDLNVFPRRAVNGVVNRHGIHSKQFSQSLVGKSSVQILASDLKHAFSRQFCSRRFLSFGVSIFRDAVLNIFHSCTSKKVIWIYARAMVASVTYIMPDRDFAVMDLERKPVRADEFFVRVKNAIACICKASQVRPTFIVRFPFHFSPKSEYCGFRIRM